MTVLMEIKPRGVSRVDRTEGSARTVLARRLQLECVR